MRHAARCMPAIPQAPWDGQSQAAAHRLLTWWARPPVQLRRDLGGG
jgi:hypothetical protein